jgi:hypothetical protein
MSLGLRIGHAGYQTPRKPLPEWLFYTLFWLIVPPGILAVIVGTVVGGLWERLRRQRLR